MTMTGMSNAPTPPNVTMSQTMSPNADRPGNASVGTIAGPQLRDMKKKLPLRVLSAQDFEHWQQYGYVIVRNAVSQTQNFRKWTRMTVKHGRARNCATMP